jgi:hypothetical protein
MTDILKLMAKVVALEEMEVSEEDLERFPPILQFACIIFVIPKLRAKDIITLQEVEVSEEDLERFPPTLQFARIIFGYILPGKNLEKQEYQ